MHGPKQIHPHSAYHDTHILGTSKVQIIFVASRAGWRTDWPREDYLTQPTAPCVIRKMRRSSICLLHVSLLENFGHGFWLLWDCKIGLPQGERNHSLIGGEKQPREFQRRSRGRTHRFLDPLEAPKCLHFWRVSPLNYQAAWRVQRRISPLVLSGSAWPTHARSGSWCWARIYYLGLVGWCSLWSGLTSFSVLLV